MHRFTCHVLHFVEVWGVLIFVKVKVCELYILKEALKFLSLTKKDKISALRRAVKSEMQIWNYLVSNATSKQIYSYKNKNKVLDNPDF